MDNNNVNNHNKRSFIFTYSLILWSSAFRASVLQILPYAIAIVIILKSTIEALRLKLRLLSSLPSKVF